MQGSPISSLYEAVGVGLLDLFWLTKQSWDPEIMR